MGGPYFFRDGSQYTGHQVVNFSVQKGQGKVRIRARCKECNGRPGSHHWPHGRCGACKGTGINASYSWVSVYSAERLNELNASKHRKHMALSALALLMVKRDFRQFLRQRDRLLTDMQTFAPKSENLQLLLAKVNQGTILTPTEIRQALTLVNTVRSQFYVAASCAR
ncbi:hypothetical protein Nazgul26 [Burkholderia phage BcepNazgul]|uniref:Uncharacterized protein n=1 Tax=Burkholderia phage BcepNazgul TaxID=242861 RepID=Q6UYL4_9CAUD|nr:hypothetical protein Nazgul26 [Burkholderia phage BcepNazgul]AAQ63327.1 conserved hypothetical protein [Burkholderia phage BcepNazgul]